MNPDDYTIQDILDMTLRERDRVAAEWSGQIEIYSVIDENGATGEKNRRAPKYQKYWRECGRLLEDLPLAFKRSPGNWFYDRMGQGIPYTGHKILSKESIVLAACICAVEGTEPRGGE